MVLTQSKFRTCKGESERERRGEIERGREREIDEEKQRKIDKERERERYGQHLNTGVRTPGPTTTHQCADVHAMQHCWQIAKIVKLRKNS